MCLCILRYVSQGNINSKGEELLTSRHFRHLMYAVSTIIFRVSNKYAVMKLIELGVHTVNLSP